MPNPLPQHPEASLHGVTSTLDNGGRGYRVTGAGRLPQYALADLYH